MDRNLVELNKLLKGISKDSNNLNTRTRTAYIRHLKGLMVPLMEDSGRWSRKAIKEFETSNVYLNVFKELQGPRS